MPTRKELIVVLITSVVLAGGICCWLVMSGTWKEATTTRHGALGITRVEADRRYGDPARVESTPDGELCVYPNKLQSKYETHLLFVDGRVVRADVVDTSVP